MLLRHEINSFNREKYCKVNMALEKIVIAWSNRYPSPDEYEVVHPNTRRVVDIWKQYLVYEKNFRLAKLLSAVLRVVVSKIEHSPNWRDRFSWFVEELRSGDWKNRAYNHPVNDWGETKPYGGR